MEFLENADIVIFASGFKYSNSEDEQAGMKKRLATSNDYRNAAIHTAAGRFPIIIEAESFDDKFFKKLRDRLNIVKTFRRIAIIAHGNANSIGLSGNIRLNSNGSWLRFDRIAIHERSLEKFPRDVLQIIKKKATNDAHIVLFTCNSGTEPDPSYGKKEIGQAIADTFGITTVGFRTYLLFCVILPEGKKWPIKEYGGAILEPLKLVDLTITDFEDISFPPPCNDKFFNKNLFKLLEKAKNEDSRKNNPKLTIVKSFSPQK